MGQVQNYLPDIPPFSKYLPMFSLIEGRKNSPMVAIKSTQKDSDPNPGVVLGRSSCITRQFSGTSWTSYSLTQF